LSEDDVLLTVSEFADLCARLEVGSARREELLAEAGVDGAGWSAIRAEWLTRLTDPDSPELPWTFGRAYVRSMVRALEAEAPTREAVGETEAAPVEPEVSEPDDSAPEETGENEETLVGIPTLEEPDPDATAIGAFPLAGSALPFKAGSFVPGHTMPRLARVEAAPAHDDEPSDPTVVPTMPPNLAALPFYAPPRTSPARPGRWVHFDAQTGAPLATPIWVNEDEKQG
jgi:hypothetical protein